MDAELKAYLDNIARAFDHRFDELKADMRDVREEMRDVREEMRSVRDELRSQSQRISNVSIDYYEARRVRDLRTIGKEARVQELERRLAELEGGARSRAQTALLHRGPVGRH